MSRRRGVTLVEVLTVIGILGVLMGILTIVLGPGVMKARTKPTCANNLRQVVQAYHLYLADNDGAWPYHGGMVENPYVWGLYKPPRSCPLNSAWRYWDSYSRGRYMLFDVAPPRNSEWKPPQIVRTAFPDGRPVPRFDPERDVLVRCLDHSTGNFTRGSHLVWNQDAKNLRGRVLGARFDGSVGYVPPISCWEASYVASEAMLDIFPGCDDPTTNR